MQPDLATEPTYVWDFFLAHAGSDEPVARSLHALLAPSCRVFLDSVCLLLGDDWDQRIVIAQRQSRITVVLISGRTEKAYYQREEIAAAIAFARKDGQTHRVVPVYLDGPSQTAESVPYGLRLKHGLQLDAGGLSEIADRLRGLLNEINSSSPSVFRESTAVPINDAFLSNPADSPRKVSGVIELGSPHYVSRAADALVEELITTPRSFPYILEPRQMGKSSLTLRAIEHAKLLGLLPIYLDLQLDGASIRRTYEDFANWLFAILVAETGVSLGDASKVFSPVLPPGRNLTALVEMLAKTIDKFLVLVLDEVDLLLDTNWGADFMGLLRAWHGRGAASSPWKDRFNILMVGSSEPHHLMPGTAGSPFNVGIRITLSDFALQEIRQLAASYGVGLEDSAFSFVHEQLGGHPFLTHNLFRQIAGLGSFSRAILPTLLNSDIFENHLERLRVKLRQNPELAKLLTGMSSRGIHVDDSPATALYRIGVFRREGQRLFWRCQLYRDRLLRQ